MDDAVLVLIRSLTAAILAVELRRKVMEYVPIDVSGLLQTFIVAEIWRTLPNWAFVFVLVFPRMSLLMLLKLCTSIEGLLAVIL